MTKYIFSLFTILTIFFISCKSVSEEQFESSSKAAIIKKEKTLFHRIIFKDSLIITFQKHDSLSISFYRQHKDSAWSSISFGRWPHKAFENTDTINLSSYVKQIDTCWNYVSKLGPVDIKTLVLKSPQHYPDILKNHVNALNTDSIWNSKINYYKKAASHEKYINNDFILTTNYACIKQIMFKYDTYNPVNDFLKKKGFEISGYMFENMDSISNAKQLQIGVKTPILTPTPENIFILVQETLDSPLPIPDIHFFSDKMNRHTLGGQTIIDAYLDSYFPITKHKTGTREAIDHPEYPDGDYCGFTTEYGDISVIVNYGCDSYSLDVKYEFNGYNMDEVKKVLYALLPKVFDKGGYEVNEENYGWMENEQGEKLYYEDGASNFHIIESENIIIVEYGVSC